jgi:2-dehydropantoate 2-reductase
MEIDPLVTVVQEMGRMTGIPTPALDTVLALVAQRAKIAGLYNGIIVLSQTVAVIEAENQVIEEIQYLARGGPDESRSGWR